MNLKRRLGKVAAVSISITFALSLADPTYADNTQAESDEDGRLLKQLYQELGIDLEELSKDSLNKELIDRPDRYRTEDVTGGTGLERNREFGGEYGPDLTRNRQGFDTGLGGKAKEGIGGGIDRMASYTYHEYNVDGKRIGIFILDDDTWGSRDSGELDWLFGQSDGEDSIPSYWILRSQGEALAEAGELDLFLFEVGRAVLNKEKEAQEKYENRDDDDDDDGGYGILGGNDNDEDGKDGPLSKFRPIEDGTNGTIRIGGDDIRGGELEGEIGDSNGGLSGTIRFAPGLDDDLTDVRTGDINGGIYLILEDLMTGGGGFDPSDWDDSDGGVSAGEIGGNILP